MSLKVSIMCFQPFFKSTSLRIDIYPEYMHIFECIIFGIKEEVIKTLIQLLIYKFINSFNHLKYFTQFSILMIIYLKFYHLKKKKGTFFHCTKNVDGTGSLEYGKIMSVPCLPCVDLSSVSS